MNQEAIEADYLPADPVKESRARQMLQSRRAIQELDANVDYKISILYDKQDVINSCKNRLPVPPLRRLGAPPPTFDLLMVRKITESVSDSNKGELEMAWRRILTYGQDNNWTEKNYKDALHSRLGGTLYKTYLSMMDDPLRTILDNLSKLYITDSVQIHERELLQFKRLPDETLMQMMSRYHVILNKVAYTVPAHTRLEWKNNELTRALWKFTSSDGKKKMFEHQQKNHTQGNYNSYEELCETAERAEEMQRRYDINGFNASLQAGANSGIPVVFNAEVPNGDVDDEEAEIHAAITKAKFSSEETRNHWLKALKDRRANAFDRGRKMDTSDSSPAPGRPSNVGKGQQPYREQEGTGFVKQKIRTQQKKREKDRQRNNQPQVEVQQQQPQQPAPAYQLPPMYSPQPAPTYYPPQMPDYVQAQPPPPRSSRRNQNRRNDYYPQEAAAPPPQQSQRNYANPPQNRKQVMGEPFQVTSTSNTLSISRPFLDHQTSRWYAQDANGNSRYLTFVDGNKNRRYNKNRKQNNNDQNQKTATAPADA